MQLRTTIEYADPGEIPVTITLTGTLAGFERLNKVLKDKVPIYEVDDLVYMIDEATRSLRGRTTITEKSE